MVKAKISSKTEETLRLGEKMGENISSAQVILLKGELGSGKTVFVKGLARGLEIKKEITSPTYILVNEYYEGRKPLFHMDLYRLDEPGQLSEIGFSDYLYREGVLAVEWPEIAEEYFPSEYIMIEFKVQNPEKREIRFKAQGQSGQQLLEQII